MSNQRARNKKRGGAAVVEFALWLPPIALLVFASIESANLIFLDQSVSIASYEGARAAARNDATNGDVTWHCNRILDLRQVKGATISISSPTLATNSVDVDAVPRGEQITVSVSAPCGANNNMAAWFFANKAIESRVTMVKE